jgi:hypothetical protein
VSAKRSLQLAAVLGLVLFVVLLIALGARPGGSCGLGAEPSAAADRAIPADLMALYQQAEHDYGVPWSVLAAINSVETGFGTHLGPSPAGALGPMQFLPGTWRRYGVDANGDGHKDVMDPTDAIGGAARYLKASGAPGDLPRALFAYNHAGWYVDKVVALAGVFALGGAVVIAAGACTEPIGDAGADAVIAAAEQLDALHVPYNFGAGHVTPAVPGRGSDGPFDGLDCSSAISWVLQHAGLKLATLDSTALMRWGDPGPGRRITIYANPTHTFGRFDGRYFGTSAFGHPAAGGGAAWFTATPSRAYLAGFAARHPPGR